MVRGMVLPAEGPWQVSRSPNVSKTKLQTVWSLQGMLFCHGCGYVPYMVNLCFHVLGCAEVLEDLGGEEILSAK